VSLLKPELLDSLNADHCTNADASICLYLEESCPLFGRLMDDQKACVIQRFPETWSLGVFDAYLEDFLLQFFNLQCLGSQGLVACLDVLKSNDGESKLRVVLDLITFSQDVIPLDQHNLQQLLVALCKCDLSLLQQFESWKIDYSVSNKELTFSDSYNTSEFEWSIGMKPKYYSRPTTGVFRDGHLLY